MTTSPPPKLDPELTRAAVVSDGNLHYWSLMNECHSWNDIGVPQTALTRMAQID